MRASKYVTILALMGGLVQPSHALDIHGVLSKTPPKTQTSVSKKISPAVSQKKTAPQSDILLPPPTVSVDQFYPGHISVGAYYQNNNGGGIGILDVFQPVWQTPDTLAFLDMRFTKRKMAQHEENIGVGVRHLMPSQQWMWGAYGFFDRRHTVSKNDFLQVTLGGELKSDRWELDGNAYVPFGRISREHSDHDQDVLVNPDLGHVGYYDIWFSGSLERSYAGVDGEVGFDITPRLKCFAGAYSFHRKGSAIQGPLLRATYDVPVHWGGFQAITFETDVRHDSERGTYWLAGLRGRSQFAKAPVLHGAARHLLDDVRRDIDIQTEVMRAPYHEYVHDDGSPITVKFVNTAADLTEDADILMVEQDLNGLSTLSLHDDQMLMSGDYHFKHNGTDYTLESRTHQEATLTAANGQDLIHLGTNNTVKDITLKVEPNTGHRVLTNVGTSTKAPGNLTLENVKAHGLTYLDAEGVSNVQLKNNVFDSDAYANTGASGSKAVVDLHAGAGKTLTVAEFSGNTIRAEGNNMTGLHHHATGNGAHITYLKDIESNTFDLNHAVYGLFNQADSGTAQLNFQGMTKNQWHMTNMLNNGAGLRQTVALDGAVTYANAVSHNQLDLTGVGGSTLTGWQDQITSGVLRYEKPWTYNTLSVTAGTAIDVEARVSGGGEWRVREAMADNAWTATSTETSGSLGAFFLSQGTNSTLEFDLFADNTITVNTSGGSGTAETMGVAQTAVSLGAIRYHEPVRANLVTVKALSGHDGIAWFDDLALGGKIEYQKPWNDNKLSLESTGETAMGLKVSVAGSGTQWDAFEGLENNQFTVSNTKAKGAAVWFDAETSGLLNVYGFEGNQLNFTATGAGTSGELYGLKQQVLSGGQMKHWGPVAENTIMVNAVQANTAVAQRGWEDDLTNGDLAYQNVVEDNTVTLKANGQDVAAWSMSLDGGATLTEQRALDENTVSLENELSTGDIMRFDVDGSGTALTLAGMERNHLSFVYQGSGGMTGSINGVYQSVGGGASLTHQATLLMNTINITAIDVGGAVESAAWYDDVGTGTLRYQTEALWHDNQYQVNAGGVEAYGLRLELDGASAHWQNQGGFYRERAIVQGGASELIGFSVLAENGAQFDLDGVTANSQYLVKALGDGVRMVTKGGATRININGDWSSNTMGATTGHALNLDAALGGKIAFNHAFADNLLQTTTGTSTAYLGGHDDLSIDMNAFRDNTFKANAGLTPRLVLHAGNLENNNVEIRVNKGAVGLSAANGGVSVQQTGVHALGIYPFTITPGL